MRGQQVADRISALHSLPIADLKRMWWTLCDSKMPEFNRAFIEQHIAYRLQEITYGGLSAKTIETLKILRRYQTDAPKKIIVKPPAGVVLIKEYDGVEHRVHVLADGFEYAGKQYKSLSAIAKKITGTVWNGPKFFGLRS